MESSIVYDSDLVARGVFARMKVLAGRRALLGLLVRREITVRYKRSVLGMWWTLLNPLVTAGILWLVFSQIFERSAGDDTPYIVYLLSGVLFMALFNQGLNAATGAITGARPILIKVAVPAETFTWATVIASGVNFLLSLIPLLLIMLITGTALSWLSPLSLIPVVLLMLLVIGLGLALSVLAVQFYDVLDLVRVITQLTIWTVPTFYPLSIIPDEYIPYFKANPLFHYLESFRLLFYADTMPSWVNFAVMIGASSLALFVGLRLFARQWRSVAVML